MKENRQPNSTEGSRGTKVTKEKKVSLSPLTYKKSTFKECTFSDISMDAFYTGEK